MSNLYKRTPSELLCIEDEYTGYCLNEACAYIQERINAGENPKFKTQFKSFKDLYAHYGRG